MPFHTAIMDSDKMDSDTGHSSDAEFPEVAQILALPKPTCPPAVLKHVKTPSAPSPSARTPRATLETSRGLSPLGSPSASQVLQHQETDVDISQTVKVDRSGPSDGMVETEDPPSCYSDAASLANKKRDRDISSDEPSDLPTTLIHPRLRAHSSRKPSSTPPHLSPLPRKTRRSKTISQASSVTDDSQQSSPQTIKIPISLSQPLPLRRLASQLHPPPPQSQPPHSSNSSRRAKRLRIDSPPASSPVRVKANPSRHLQFWHLDGSVVIQIENTIFRLHRSRLAQQSGYFANTFAKSPAEPNVIELGDDDGVVDRCPVYKVAGVAVDDFAALLTALDSGIKFAMKPPPFPVLASILRAAHALKFEVMTEYTTFRLCEMWPRTLSRLSSSRTAYPSETILLAQQCNVPEVSSAHTTSSSARPLRASHRDTREAPGEWVQVTRAPPAPSAVPCPLEHIHANGSLNPGLLPTLQKCRDARAADSERWSTEVVRSAVFDEYMYDPLVGLDRLVDMDWAGMGHCVGCVNARREMWTEKKEKLWAQLDEWLRLPVLAPDAGENDGELEGGAFLKRRRPVRSQANSSCIMQASHGR
ncbi:hypothetical protein B0H21DRAFT_895581 [Amylocystis lapponica]|nr:hypothetical protein B0H21DRAFT_895581 [Amylocystis lapponica]